MHKLKVFVSLPLLTVLFSGTVRAAVQTPQQSDPNRAVALFVSQRMFMEESLQTIIRRLQDKSFRPVIVAHDTGLATGMDGSLVRPGIVLADCRPADFAAFIVINGSGIALNWEDTLLLERCRRFAETGRIVGGVGIGTICLADAGILNGRKATIMPDRRAVNRILAGGARYVKNPVVTDGNIITAQSTDFVRRFVDVLVAMLNKRLQEGKHSGQ